MEVAGPLGTPLGLAQRKRALSPAQGRRGGSDVGDTDQLSRSGLKRELQVGPEEAETAIPGKGGGEPWARKWELVPPSSGAMTRTGRAWCPERPPMSMKMAASWIP